MKAQRRRLLRRLETPAGERLLVQVPHDQEVAPGWLSYALLAIGPEPGVTLRLMLHERVAHQDGSDPRAA